MRAPKKNVKYHIYGRTAYPDPLAYIQTVDQAALALPGGQEWVEVIAFPETAVIQVIPRPPEKQPLAKRT